jgi:sortase A
MLYKYIKKTQVNYSYNQPVNIYAELATNKKANNLFFSISVFSLLTGIAILIYSFYPYISAFTLNASSNSEKTVLASTNSNLALSEASGTGSLSSVYTANLVKNLSETSKALGINDNSVSDEVLNKTGEMKLSIPRLKIQDMPVKINVNSYNEKDYMPILDYALAHFKGTSLPSYPGNTFVYGHSTNELIARSRPNSPQVAFTFLNRVEIGDEISIELEGKIHRYALQRSRIVEPEDISPIFGNNSKETLTLMTCWPPGIGEKRLILVAEQI